jgi:dienelactone hydrolase
MSTFRFTRGLALAILLFARAAHAQRDEATFVMRLGTDTVMVEGFSREPGMVRGVASLNGRARMVYSYATAADASVSSFQLGVWPAGTPDSTPPAQRISINLSGDSAKVVIDAGGQHLTPSLGGARGAIALVNPSVVMMEQLVLRARALGGADSVAVPALLVGGSSVVTAWVYWKGADSAVVTLGGVAVHARVDRAGHILGATIPSQRIEIVREAGARSAAVVPPDYSAPVGAPYRAIEVRVPHPGGFQLGGTLTLPNGRGPWPAVVTITGSGLEDRDEAIPGVRGYRPFRQVADTLGRRGIAVLRLDDRGFGASGGNAGSATSRDFAGDVAAAVAWLRGRPDIDPARIALVGHSEGGIIAPMLAADDPALRAVVLVAGTARTGQRVLDYQIRWGVEHDSSIPAAARDSAVRALWVRTDSMVARIPWLGFFMTYDPLPTARRVRQPVLILQGESDRQVTADQAPELAAAIRAGGNRDVTLRVFPALNHLMAPDPDGSPAGYATLPVRAVSREVLGVLADWLVARLR